MARSFDYTAFKAQFRQSAKARGIDPVEGATSYQVATLKADLRKQAILDAPDYDWWQGRAIFSEGEDRWWGEVRIVQVPEHKLAEDPAMVPFDGASIAELWREIVGEVVEIHDMPLNELHQHQRAWTEATAARKQRTRVKWSPGAASPQREVFMS